MSSAGSHSRPGFDPAPEAARPSFAPPDFARSAPPRSLIPLLAIIFAAQIALIALLGWNNRWQISEDGVAYLRIASYYASWQTHLMVNGYWGPMLSWLMAPLVGIVPHPLYAARLVMGLSAVVFLLGSISLFRRLELPPAAVAVGALCAAVIGASLSAISITPDLLVAGLICLGASFLLSRSWLNRRATPWAAGIVFGLAYLAKAVALPVFCALLVALVCCELLYQRGKRRAVIGRAVVTMFAFVITAGPWIGLISQKYSRPVFSTTAAIAHAYMGPGDRPRGHPFTTSFLRPEPGRITVWEDPSELPYPSWSPLASRDNLVHQLQIIRDNSYAILNLVSRWDWLRLGPLLLLIGFLVHAPWSVNFRDQRWRLAALGVFAVCVVYLPIYASVPRYYYVTIPFLLTVALGVVTQLTAKDDFGPNPGRVIALSVIALSFSAPVVRDAAVLLRLGTGRAALDAAGRAHEGAGRSRHDCRRCQGGDAHRLPERPASSGQRVGSRSSRFHGGGRQSDRGEAALGGG